GDSRNLSDNRLFSYRALADNGGRSTVQAVERGGPSRRAASSINRSEWARSVEAISGQALSHQRLRRDRQVLYHGHGRQRDPRGANRWFRTGGYGGVESGALPYEGFDFVRLHWRYR